MPQSIEVGFGGVCWGIPTLTRGAAWGSVLFGVREVMRTPLQSRLGFLAGSFQSGDFFKIGVDVRFAAHTFEGHPADLAEDGTLLPRAVVQAEAPEDVRVRVRVARVHGVAVVEGQHRLERRF